MAKLPKPFTDGQLEGLEKSNLAHLGRNEAMVRKLIGELRMARRLVEQLEAGYLRMRSQLVELDREILPAGRVLVVECPPEPHTSAVAETVLLADGKLDLHRVACPVECGHSQFEDVLRATLELPVQRTPIRFQNLLKEATRRQRVLRHYQRDWQREIEAMMSAQATQDVLDALNELRDRPNEAIENPAQDAAASEEAKPQAVEAPPQVEGDCPPGAAGGSSAEGVPW